MQLNEAITARRLEEFQTGRKAMLMQKIRNASLKKYYESKIASLSDRKMPPQLLSLMCQDAPVAKENLNSRWGRQSFVKQCLRYYRGQLREIERSEQRWFSCLF